MTLINAYFNFNGNCREAMMFYQDCFGGELSLQTVEGSPMEKHLPPSAKDQILHASLTTDTLVLMASEMVGPQGYKPGNSVALCINCSDENDARNYFSKLSENGKITCALADSFWGGLYGAVTDQFGVNWLVNAEKRSE
jgi:PhnB protein